MSRNHVKTLKFLQQSNQTETEEGSPNVGFANVNFLDITCHKFLKYFDTELQ